MSTATTKAVRYGRTGMSESCTHNYAFHVLEKRVQWECQKCGYVDYTWERIPYINNQPRTIFHLPKEAKP